MSLIASLHLLNVLNNFMSQLSLAGIATLNHVNRFIVVWIMFWLGLGAKETHDKDWIAHQEDFNNLLSALNQHGGNAGRLIFITWCPVRLLGNALLWFNCGCSPLYFCFVGRIKDWRGKQESDVRGSQSITETSFVCSLELSRTIKFSVVVGQTAGIPRMPPSRITCHFPVLFFF